jgi:hypothetical protein
MNFDDILGKLMPLFEQKMAFSMEMSKRAMSLEERKAERQTDLEYRKLEAQITNDKDKLKWEKEKLTTAIKGDFDLQTLKNSGMLDTERLKGINEKEKQKIMEEGANSRAKLNADTETNKAYLTTLGTILGHAVEKTGIDAQGNAYSTKPTADVGTAARSLMEQTGLAKPAVTPKGRNVAGEAEVAAGILREHEKAGTADAARNYLNALDPTVRAETLKLLNPGGVTPATVVAPTAPAPGVRTPIPAVQAAAPLAEPPAPAVEPVRPVVQPTVASPALSQGKTFAAAGPLGGDGKTAFGGTPGGLLGEVWKRGGMKAADILKQRQDEEEKNRALRRARGLTVGGF